MTVSIQQLEDIDQETFLLWASIDMTIQRSLNPGSEPPMNAVMYYSLSMDHFRNDYQFNVEDKR